MSKTPEPKFELPKEPVLPAIRDTAPTLDKDTPVLVRSALTTEQIAGIFTKNTSGLVGVDYAKAFLNHNFALMWDFQIIEKEYSRVDSEFWSAMVQGRLIVNHPTGQTLIVRDRMGYSIDAYVVTAINEAADEALIECVKSLGADL